jgi:tetratricopeptide (TPR) repeat protein
MKTSYFITISLVLAITGLLPVNAQQTAEQLYQSGLYKEEIEGDLNAAIKVYETIIDKFPENRSIGAKTYLHLGLGYEKLGVGEAQKAYRKVLDNYPEQKQEVAMAKENLERLLAFKDTRGKPTYTKIRIPTKLSWAVRLSPDGKNLGLVSDAKIYVMPLSGNLGPDIPGPPLQLNTNEVPVEYTDLNWSADGKWIAFNDPGISGPKQGIYVMSSAGGNP